ncbi:glycosyltransferase [Microbacterium neungamense]|uniref:glycosyltransferase n=1 Tax=Microbacterium neungamense TaxID=2810535 RepID=UPI00217CE73C|nr:glycosyltransferase [Microbacterium neungamense]UWF77898.1 glycosyltransferase [Microbacterium neungamense]
MSAWRGREQALRGEGVDVTLAAARNWHAGGVPVSLSAAADDPVTGVATIGRHPALFLYDPRPLWRLLGERWDLIDVHEEPFALCTAEILLLRALRRNRAPYALYTAQNLRKRYPFPFGLLERRALRGAAAVSACNREAAAIAEAKGFPGRARVIPLGVELPGTVPERRADAGTITVGLLGRLVPEKGVHMLLDALARDERLHARIAGAGPLAETLQTDAAARAVADRVSFLGAIPPDEVAEFYRGIDVLAVPSIPTARWTEQFGRVAVEAMAHAVPVVSSDAGALPDVVGDAGIVVPHGDAAALADALVRAHERREELRDAGLRRARECSWPAVARQYLAMYRTALANRTDAEHTDAEHTDAEPADAEHTDAEPADAEPADAEPVEASPRTPGPSTRSGSGGSTGSGPVEVVVVAYGAPELVERALAPVVALPVTVVDNSSMPEIAALCQRLGVRYLDPGANLGFGAAVNRALADRLAPGADVLLLNPDARIDPAGISALHRALHAEPRLASVGPAQVDERGREARVEWVFPSPGRAWLEALGLARLNRGPRYVIGSVLLLRAEAVAQVGGFDERFFLYAEEADWAYRAHLLGWQHRAVPAVRAVHTGAGTSTDPRRREAHFHAGQERYYRKHFGATGWAAARAAQWIGATARGCVLRGDRARDARRRAALYRLGPMRVEQQWARSR